MDRLTGDAVPLEDDESKEVEEAAGRLVLWRRPNSAPSFCCASIISWSSSSFPLSVVPPFRTGEEGADEEPKDGAAFELARWFVLFQGQILRTVCEVIEVVKETMMCFSMIQIRSLHEVRLVL